MIYEEILTMLSPGLKSGSKLPSVQTGNLRAIWSKAKHSQDNRKERITALLAELLTAASKLYVFISRRSRSSLSWAKQVSEFRSEQSSPLFLSPTQDSGWSFHSSRAALHQGESKGGWNWFLYKIKVSDFNRSEQNKSWQIEWCVYYAKLSFHRLTDI